MTGEVPPPRRAGVSDVPGLQVAAGFMLGLMVSWGLRMVFLSALEARDQRPTVGEMALALFVPTAILIGTFAWAWATRRKAIAIGLAVYAAVGGLVLVPVAPLFLICGTR